MDRRKLGKYEVLCRLSTGGMSEIYLAQQGGVGGFNKLVVLKTILPDISGEEDFVRMFLDEARTTAAFNHPNIAQVYELETSEGVLFMAMEFVQGCTLVEMARACRQAKEPIPVGFTLAAVRDTALALHYAHGYVDPRGRRQIVIHRDVAEKNIMVTYEGVTKLLDFGIAKALGRSAHTNAGMVKGTSGYMSPEQIRGEPLDPRSDIFSLGVVLHECLTGLRLFHGKNAEEGMMAALKGEVAPPSRWNPGAISPELDAVVMKALAKDRDVRFATALEFARAIEKAVPGGAWHPEQTGELVVRHFADRRAETRRTLEAALGSERTGEVRVQSLIARMKAADPKKSSPSPVPSGPPMLAPMPVLAATQPGIAPYLPEGPAPAPREAMTSPARPKSLRPSPVPAPPEVMAKAVDLESTVFEDDDDSEHDAKTIPAAALPEEIKELRRRMLDADARRTQQASPVGLPSTSGVLPPPPRPRSDFSGESLTLPPEARVVAEPRPLVRASTPSGLRGPTPPRTETGETLSITHRASPWEDERRAAVATRPSNRGGAADDGSPSVPTLQPVQVGPSKGPLVVVLVLLLVVAAVGGLWLAGVLPGAKG